LIKREKIVSELGRRKKKGGPRTAEASIRRGGKGDAARLSLKENVFK